MCLLYTQLKQLSFNIPQNFNKLISVWNNGEQASKSVPSVLSCFVNSNTGYFSYFFYCVMEEEKVKIPVWYAEAPLILFIEYHFWICIEAWYHSLVYFELSFCKFWMGK